MTLQEQIDNILNTAKQFNKEKGITGVLLYNDTRFVQYLEGEYKQIMELFESIKKDPRHNNVVIVTISTVPKRLFPSWQMGGRKIGSEQIDFRSNLNAEEAELFSSILEGKSENTPRAVEIIHKFF